MGKDESDWKRRREREDEEEAAAEAENLGKAVNSSTRAGANNLDPTIPKQNADKFDDLLQRADPMIEQLNNLYHMYAVGVESLPPIERRRNLDTVMLSLQMMPKLTPSSLFKYNSILSRYQSYKERWDKLIKDIESGKVKRQNRK